MSISKHANQKIVGVVGLSLLAAGVQSPAIAQTISLDDLRVTDTPTLAVPEVDELLASDLEIPDIGLTFDETSVASPAAVYPVELSPVNAQPNRLLTELERNTSSAVEPAVEPAATVPVVTPAMPGIEESAVAFQTIQPVTEAAALAYPNVYATDAAADEVAFIDTIAADGGPNSSLSHGLNPELANPTEAPVELAQARRRTRGTALGSDYIGIGADIGYADDFGFAAISKFSFARRFAVRPAVVIGDEFSVLVPITYDFSQYSSDVGGFPVRPYAGVGASYTNRDDDDDDENGNDDDDSSDINLLLSAGIDIPLSRRFTLNGQVNWGVLEESQFGVTVGVGYNLGNLIGR